MGFLEVVQAVFIPAIIAAALYAIGAYVIVPAVKRYRSRYSQYLPLDSISQHTHSIRDRIADTITRLVVPRRMTVVDAVGSRRGSVNGEEDLEASDGDRMFGFDDVNRCDRQVRGANVDTGRGQGWRGGESV